MPVQQSDPNFFESRQKSGSGKAGSATPQSATSQSSGSRFSATSNDSDLLHPDDDLVTPSRLRQCARKNSDPVYTPARRSASADAGENDSAVRVPGAPTSMENEADNSAAVRTASLEACLRAAREAKGLTVDQVSDDLKLRSDIVTCLEHGNFDFAHRVYVNGFLRAYAEYLGKETLGMSPDEAADALKKEHPEVFEPEPEAIELQPLKPKGVPKLAVALVLFILIGAIGAAVWFWQENSTGARIEAAPAVPEKLSLYLPADAADE